MEDKKLSAKTFIIDILTILVVLLIGNTIYENWSFRKEEKSIEEKITLSSGYRIDELENDISRFIMNVYDPKNEEDIERGVSLMEKYMVDSTYDNLLVMKGEYRPEIKSEISNVVVEYSSSENSITGRETLYTEFKVKNGNLEQDNLIEFYLNEEGYIYNFSVWLGEAIDTKFLDGHR